MYIHWAIKAFFLLSVLVILPTSFLHLFMLVCFWFFMFIQTPRNRVSSSRPFTFTGTWGVPIWTKASSLLFLFAMISDFFPFISISFNVKKLFDMSMTSWSFCWEGATYVVSSANARADTSVFSSLVLPVWMSFGQFTFSLYPRPFSWILDNRRS